MVLSCSGIVVLCLESSPSVKFYLKFATAEIRIDSVPACSQVPGRRCCLAASGTMAMSLRVYKV